MEIHTEMAVEPAVKRSRKTRLMTVEHLDRRTRASKRAREIAAELARGWDGMITAVQQQAVERAGMLCALAEDLLARRLAGQPVSLDELLRAEGCAKRAVRTVLAERPKPLPAPRFSPMKAVREAEAARKAQAEKEPLDEYPA
jgi:hypothetical protein